MKYYIGVDVGTGSARAGVFDEKGNQLGLAKCEITTVNPQIGWAEQSSHNIWKAVCFSVKNAINKSKLKSTDITAIGFDATCSLALADKNFNPLSLSSDSERDVILWMDQRAVTEAQECSNTNTEPLNYVGGTMSPEMQMPKLLWLKRNRPDIWNKLGYAGDLSDWLTRKATGSNARSVCTLTCKWGFMPHKNESWDKEFLSAIDLCDVIEKADLPQKAEPVGAAIGYLTQQAAYDLGLHTNCIVSAGMIDAHAGAVVSFSLLKSEKISQTLGLVAGTSNCHMALNDKMLSIAGVWGPYQGVVKSDYWLNEGGQTATGALLEYLIQNYKGADNYLPDIHNSVSKELYSEYMNNNDPAPNVHILPDFIGNRAPYADPTLRGVISGLTFTTAQETFKQIYWAAACSIAYGTRAIMERMQENGYDFEQIVLTGGHSKSNLLKQLYADATGCDLILPKVDEPVLLGSAMTACAATFQGSFEQALKLAPSVEYFYCDKSKKDFHNKRYQSFKLLYKHYKEIKL